MGDAERRRSQKDRRGLERRLQNLQAKAQQDDQRAMQLVQAQEALRRKLQAETGLEKESLEMQVERLTKENRNIKERSRSLIARARAVHPLGLASDVAGSAGVGALCGDLPP